MTLFFYKRMNMLYFVSISVAHGRLASCVLHLIVFEQCLTINSYSLPSYLRKTWRRQLWTTDFGPGEARLVRLHFGGHNNRKLPVYAVDILNSDSVISINYLPW